MLTALTIPPGCQEFPRCLRHFWFISVKQEAGGAFGQSGIVFGYVCRPTQRQVRQAKKIAKVAFRDYLKQGGAA